jgi:hypothetical protein
MTEERKEGPTPHGGAYSIAYYQNERGEAAPKAAAVKVEIVEFDAQDQPIWRTYGDLAPRD